VDFEQSPRLLPDAQQLIQDNLDGWFRYRALACTNSSNAKMCWLRSAAEQEAAEQALLKLTLIGSIPALGCGWCILLIFW